MTHSRTVVRLPASSLLVGLALLVSSCASGLAFVQDDRLTFTAPEARALVTLPVTVGWSIDGFRVTGPDGAADPGAGSFGVFIDRAPVPPGQTLAWIARDDTACRRTPGCPDAVYLSDRRAYTTTEPTITFPQVPDLDAYKGHEVHEVTVVLLDGRGVRIGESAWHVSFRYHREGD